MDTSAPSDRGVLWKIAAAAPLPMRCWDGDYVVYNPSSGDTHVLDIVTGEVLKAIVAGATLRAELRARFAAFLEVPADARLDAQLDVVLAALEGIGLIEQQHGC